MTASNFDNRRPFNKCAATSSCFRLSVAAAFTASSRPPRDAASAPASSRSVTPASAEATTASGPWCFSIRFMAPCIARPSASETPPNFHTSQPDFVIDHLKTKGPSPAG